MIGAFAPDPGESVLCILFRAVGLPADVRAGKVALWLHDEGMLDFVRASLGDGFDRHIRNFVLSTTFAEALLAAKPGLARGPDELGDKLAANFPEGRTIEVDEMVVLAKQALLIGRSQIPLTLIVIDEVQQFIRHDPRVTLKIQMIAERFGMAFDGRVLVVATGQQALSDVDYLVKLLDRFSVPVALAEADIDAVIRQTVLRKRPGAENSVREMLHRHAGEISRHLHGSKIAHTSQDEAAAILDWPLLPSRRRVWDLILRELDRTSMGSTLRGQLRITLDAARQMAPKPLGHAVPADFLYGRVADEASNAGLLPSETRNRIEKLRGGTGDDPLKARIVMLVYMLGRIREGAERHGVRARAEAIADLLIEDLAGEPELRRKVPELLAALRDDGALIEVDGDWRLQTKESAEWDQAYRQAVNEKKADEVGIAVMRKSLLGQALVAALPGTSSISHGRCAEARKINHLSPDDKAPADGVPFRRHNGWDGVITQAEKDIAAAPATDPTVHLLVDSHRAKELRDALVERAAARSVLDLKGVPQTSEGDEARKSMESREATALRQADEIIREAVAKARVVQAGGTVVTGQLASAVKTAAGNALVRMYPQFDDADHAGWGKAFAQAQKKHPDAIKAVDHQGAPETHPVCRAILGHLGAGKKGSEVRNHFGAAPYGWPQDAIDGALLILANAGQLRVTGEDGKPVTLAELPRQKIGLCGFRPETTIINVGDKLAVRGLLGAAGVAFEKEQEQFALSALLERLQIAAKEAGGEAPAPPSPTLPDAAALHQLNGNDLLKALADRATELKAKLGEWQKAKALIAQRLPHWRLAERLVALGATGQASAVEAVRSGRALLAEPDQVPPIVQAAADDLRGRLKAAWDDWQAAWAKAEARLAADADWAKITPEQKRDIRQRNGLLPAVEPKVATPQDIVAALEARGLDGWASLAKALPTRVDDALAEAAILLEPKAKVVVLPGGTLKSEAELDVWLAGLRTKILSALADGPVIPKV
jgi:hypothetical protein